MFVGVLLCVGVLGGMFWFCVWGLGSGCDVCVGFFLCLLGCGGGVRLGLVFYAFVSCFCVGCVDCFCFVAVWSGWLFCCGLVCVGLVFCVLVVFVVGVVLLCGIVACWVC